MKEKIDKHNLPRHIAVIMDGNGRWAKSRGAERIFGHKNAVKSVKDVTEGCAELGVEYLTLYAFSTENWGRPKREIDGLMRLLVSTLKGEIETLLKNDVKLQAIGEVDNLPGNCIRELEEAMAETENNTGLTLTLALSYSGRWEIIEAVKKLANDVENGNLEISSINSSIFESYLETNKLPNPELLIRTSGEMRISNFLLWQIAYSEIYFTPVLWPDFRKKDLFEAILNYQSRERRFGKVSEQVRT